VATRTTLILLAALVMPISARSKPPIQGVWRVVEMTVTDSPAGRRDPFGDFPAGTHTRFQPSLMIFTGRYYSRTTDTAAEPRPTAAYRRPANRPQRNCWPNGDRSSPTRARTRSLAPR
jgi:hypothetical protein